MEWVEFFYHYLISAVYRVISVINTYAWMQATAPSKILSIRGATIIRMALDIETLIKALPRRDISKWPAIMFAVSRTHKVIGRIRFLTSSIITIKFINGTGVPWGSR